MKIRLGFVSNSSTTSMMVSLEEYDNVIQLAGYYVLGIINYEDGQGDYKKAELFRKMYNNLLRASKSEIDQNTPVFIPTYNFDTYIVKREDAYYIDSDHEYYFDIKGPYIGGLDEGDYGKYTKSNFYYLAEFDVLGKHTRCSEESICEHGRNISLKDDGVICYICNKDKLEEHQVSPNLSEEEIRQIDEQWIEKFRTMSEYFNWNRLRKLMRNVGAEMAARESVGYLALYLEAIVKQVTKKGLKLSEGKKITSEIMEKALEWVQTIKIKY